MKKRINNELTIIIKTFERRKSLKNMLESLVKINMTKYKVIILDDSKVPYKDYIVDNIKDLDIEYIVSEFDIGLSRGRNILLEYVKTPYFLLCDDDYIFDERCNLEEALKLIKTENADIIGGIYYNYIGIHNFYEFLAAIRHPSRFYQYIFNKEILLDYSGEFKVENNILYKIQDQKKLDKIRQVDITVNFFIANLEKIKKIGGWSEDLKLGEHTEFFYRAKLNNLKVLLFRGLAIQHHPIMSFSYKKFRGRNFGNWLEKYNLNELKIIKK